MINGVLMIVAAALFAVIGIGREIDMLWLCIAGVYLLAGVVNLIVYSVKNSRKQKTAGKKAAEQKPAETATVKEA